jgi:hypothetical protein
MLLNAAKDELWPGVGPYGNKDIYICHCIDIAANLFYPDLESQANCLIELIQSRLGKYNSTVTEWLHREHNIPLSEFNDEAVQAHRLAWLNLLIKEFS